MPVHIVERLQKMNRAERTLWTQLGREPTLEEIAEEASLPIQQAIEVRAAARASTSLDQPVGEADDAVFGDFVAGDGPLPEEEVEVSLRSQALKAALEALTERERQVVVLRYGLADSEPKTLEEIGRRLGLTRERVRQIELDSLKRLAALREMEAVAVARRRAVRAASPSAVPSKAGRASSPSRSARAHTPRRGAAAVPAGARREATIAASPRSTRSQASSRVAEPVPSEQRRAVHLQEPAALASSSASAGPRQHDVSARSGWAITGRRPQLDRVREPTSRLVRAGQNGTSISTHSVPPSA